MKQELDLVGKVSEWIHSEGIPLEYYTSTVYRNVGFRVTQSDFVQEEKAISEIDVAATVDFRQGESLIRIYSVVECKYIKDKPWIVFTSPASKISEAAAISQSIGSYIGGSILWHIAGEESLYGLSMFKVQEYTGFSGRQVFSKDSDLFYNTVQSIVRKTVLSVKKYDYGGGNPFDYSAIGFPVIVLDGPLFEAKYIDDKIEIAEVPFSRLHWKGSNVWRKFVTVTLVTKDYFPQFAADHFQELQTIGKQCLSALANIKYFDEVRDPSVLSHKNAARGFVGLPEYLAKIVHSIRR